MENMEAVMAFVSILAPISLAIVELIKRTVSVKVNLLPALSLVSGLVIGAIAWPFTDLDLTLRLWAGGFAGLGGTGLFELFKQRAGVTKGGE